MQNILHLTSAHPRYEPRIFLKMCCSLYNSGDRNVGIVVADGYNDEIKSGVSIYDVGLASGSRIKRMTISVWKVYKRARILNADIFHLHDPELIPIGLLLKLRGKKVIFDSHEDLPSQLIGKPYLTKFSQYILSKLFTLFEKITCRYFDFIVAATPYICEKFAKINPNTVVINNYPILTEFTPSDKWNCRERSVLYLGGISRIRGIEQIVTSMESTTEVKLILVGSFNEIALKNNCQSKKGWENVTDLGFLNRSEVREVLSKVCAGIVTFLSSPNHIDSQPQKMFEYMSAGIPVVASNFPLWREIVEGNNCGLCVDPNDPKAIGEAIQYLVDNPQQAQLMGDNGRKAIERKYNWTNEEKNLTNIYDLLM